MLSLDAKILIADDMPTIRDLVKTQLKAMGYKNIIEAADGEQALNLLIQHDNTGSKIGMVISDWNMPKMTGLEFLKQVRASEQWLNLPFILLTSESERDQVTEAILAGVSQYIVKPFAGKAFEEKVKQGWQKHNK
ncbi:MAG: two-component system response regulator [Oligoflexia bacterium]|nr:MAG: two-component system response regulator [Oligoflexia bacterium]